MCITSSVQNGSRIFYNCRGWLVIDMIKKLMAAETDLPLPQVGEGSPPLVLRERSSSGGAQESEQLPDVALPPSCSTNCLSIYSHVLFWNVNSNLGKQKFLLISQSFWPSKVFLLLLPGLLCLPKADWWEKTKHYMTFKVYINFILLLEHFVTNSFLKSTQICFLTLLEVRSSKLVFLSYKMKVLAGLSSESLYHPLSFGHIIPTFASNVTFLYPTWILLPLP